MKTFIYRIKKTLTDFDFAQAQSTAAEIAFYLTLSIFPSLLFLICAFAYIPEINLYSIQNFLSALIPDEASKIINVLIQSAINNRSVYLLVVSFLFASWSFSKAIKSMIRGLNLSYEFEETRSLIKLTLYCLLFSIAFLIVIILCVVFIVYGNKIWELLIKILGFDNPLFTVIYNILRYSIPIALMIFIFLSFFALAPSKRQSLKSTALGAFTTTILWLLFSFLYSYYADNFNSSKQIYGSISTIIILMTWIYLCSLSVTIGYKLNAFIFKRKNII